MLTLECDVQSLLIARGPKSIMTECESSAGESSMSFRMSVGQFELLTTSEEPENHFRDPIDSEQRLAVCQR